MIAVGMENIEQAEWLKRLGCEGAQGFLYGPPIPAKSFGGFLVDLKQWEVPTIDKETHVLIVNSESDSSNSLYEALKEKHSVTISQSIFDAKQVIEEYSPEILVIAQQLEDGNWLELCQEIQTTSDSRSIVLLTESGSSNVKQQAYKVGVSDCIDNNANIEDIFSRIESLANHLINRKKMQQQYQEIQNTALGSIKETALYGDVLKVVKILHTCQDELSMATQVLKFMETRQLECVVQFRGVDTNSCFNHDGSFCNPIEIELFDSLHNKGRLYDFDGQTIVNDNHVSILIKNMPSDADEVGRIRDFVAVIIESLEARHQDTLRKRALYSVFDKLTTMADSLLDEIAVEREHKKEIIEKLNVDLQMSFHLLDLHEEQEEHITKIIDSLLSGYEENQEKAVATGERISEITNLLSLTIEDLDAMHTEEPAPPDDEVELF
jgi:DNA-binding response OmpR family regulator